MTTIRTKKINSNPDATSFLSFGSCPATGNFRFNIGIRVDAAALSIVTGQVKSFTKTADSGNKITREFCPKCGSPLFTKAPSKPEFVWIKAGSLDDSTGIKPNNQIWTDAAVPWAYIPVDLPGYPRNWTDHGDK